MATSCSSKWTLAAVLAIACLVTTAPAVAKDGKEAHFWRRWSPPLYWWASAATKWAVSNRQRLDQFS